MVDAGTLVLVAWCIVRLVVFVQLVWKSKDPINGSLQVGWAVIGHPFQKARPMQAVTRLSRHLWKFEDVTKNSLTLGAKGQTMYGGRRARDDHTDLSLVPLTSESTMELPLLR